jgi:hypothetical protein
MVTLLVVTALLLVSAASLGTVAATSTYSTLFSTLDAQESSGFVVITGTLLYWNGTTSNNTRTSPIYLGAVNLYWTTSNSTTSTYTLINQVYTDADGMFNSPPWSHGLEPGHYVIKAVYGGESRGNVIFNGCTRYVDLDIRLRLGISVDKPTVSVDNSGQGDSVTLAITASAVNSKAHPSVSLSITNLANLLGNGINATFTRLSGSTPLLSKLKLDFSNTTQAGTYTVVITATSDDDSSISQSINVYAYVQQITHTITIEVQGLPSGVSTSLCIDSTAIENIGTGTITLTISNKTKAVTVLKEIPSGDTRYLCDDYTQPADLGGSGSFVFKYVTEHRLKISGDLPPNIVCKLILNVDDTDKSDSAFKPAQGYSDFLPKDANVTFAISPGYITTTQVNYKFREWRERMTGQVIGVSNSTADGLFVVRLSRPLDLRAYYDKWVTVTIRTNLPSEMSTNLQIGLVGSEKKNVTVTGSVAYKAGEFLAGTAFECNIAQDQLVLYNAEDNIRYEFQGMSPLSPLSLDQHATIYVNYTSRYKVQVTSRFPDAVIQPPGSVGWYAPGQIATLQVANEAKDKYGIPYLFDKWSGAVSSNETTVSFPVVTPVEIEAQWKLNWMYLLTLGGGFLAVAVPSAIVVKKKVLVRVRWPKKRPFKKRDDSQDGQGGLTDDDMQVYNYIMTKGGSLKISEAAADLGMSREAIKESVEKLRKKDLLH